MLVGMEKIIVNFHCNKISRKNVSVCYKTTVCTKIFWKRLV